MVIFGRMYSEAIKYSGGSPENGIAKQIKVPRKK